jgi:putative flippase GtrA
MKIIIKKIYSYEIVRYSIGWLLAALLDLIILWICTDYIWIYYLFSAIISFFISVSFAFFFQKYITFKDKSKKYLRQRILFIVFQLIWQFIYMIILRLWVDLLWYYYMFVAIVWKLIIFIRNYTSNRHFNFKK